MLASLYNGPTPSINHNLYIRGNLVYESDSPQRPARVYRRERCRREVLREVGFFDVFPADDAPAAQAAGSWSVYPFFASGTVVVNGIEQGLFVLETTCRSRKRQPVGLEVTIAGPGNTTQSTRTGRSS